MLVGPLGPATHSNCGEPLKLPVTKPLGRKTAVARLITSGMVITPGDWAIRSQAPTSTDTGKVQRLDGCGLVPN